MLSIQSLPSFENYRPEKNWQYIDFNLFSTESYGICLMLYCLQVKCRSHINPFALRKATFAYNFGLSECSRVNQFIPYSF